MRIPKVTKDQVREFPWKHELSEGRYGTWRFVIVQHNLVAASVAIMITLAVVFVILTLMIQSIYMLIGLGGAILPIMFFMHALENGPFILENNNYALMVERQTR